MAFLFHIKQHQRASQINSLLLWGVFALLMFGPLAFGAVEPWSIFVFETASTLLLLLWIANQWIDGALKVRWHALFLPMAAFALLILSQILFHQTAYRHDTVDSALLYACYGMLCFLTSQVFDRGAQARKLAVILSIYGCVLAVFALLQGISSNGKIYWLREPRSGGWIYGPYVNHNHYAGLMEMLIPIPLVLSLTQLAPKKERTAAAVAAAIMAGTIFLSGSRGGMLSLLVELILLAIILVRQRVGMRIALVAGVFLVIIVGLSVWLGGADLSQRIASLSTETRSEISGGVRWNIDRDGFKMFLRRPIAGWGLGTFPVVYPEFRTFYTNFFVNQAHDDYLQLLVETGLLGFGIMCWFLTIFYRQAWRKIGNWSSDIGGAVALACILGLTGLLVHSTVDFNLQIPANAALFYVLGVIGAAEPFPKPMRKRRPVAPLEELDTASEVV